MARATPLFHILDEAGITYDPRETAIRSAMLKRLFPWAYCRLVRCSPEELEDWVRVSGLDELQLLIKEKRGVLLVSSHFGPGHAIKYVLGAGGHIVYNLRANDGFVQKYGISEDDCRMSREVYLKYDSTSGMLRTTVTIRNLLSQGEIVACALDGWGGSSDGIRLPLMGTQRQFRTALPLIAALEGARIVPVFSKLEADGRIAVRLDPAFPVRPPDQSPAKYAEEVVKMYVEKVQAFCESEPGHVTAVRITDR